MVLVFIMNPMRRSPSVFAVGVVALLSCFQTAPAQEKNADPKAPTMEPNVAVPIRDGVFLRADVFRPAGHGKYHQ